MPGPQDRRKRFVRDEPCWVQVGAALSADWTRPARVKKSLAQLPSYTQMKIESMRWGIFIGKETGPEIDMFDTGSGDIMPAIVLFSYKVEFELHITVLD